MAKLMRIMGGKGSLSQEENHTSSSLVHKIYAYLLAKGEVSWPNQVRGADITYIRLAHEFAFLVVVRVLWSRYVLSGIFPIS